MRKRQGVEHEPDHYCLEPDSVMSSQAARFFGWCQAYLPCVAALHSQYLQMRLTGAGLVTPHLDLGKVTPLPKYEVHLACLLAWMRLSTCPVRGRASSTSGPAAFPLQQQCHSKSGTCAIDRCTWPWGSRSNSSCLDGIGLSEGTGCLSVLQESFPRKSVVQACGDRGSHSHISSSPTVSLLSWILFQARKATCREVRPSLGMF